MRTTLAKTLLVVLLAALPACVSSSEFEHLERADALHQLETAQAKKRVQALETELAQTKSGADALEQQLAALNQSLEDRSRAVAELEAKVALKAAAVTAIEAKLARVRAALAGPTLAKEAGRKALLIELMDSTTVPAADEPAPAGPPKPPDDGIITH